MTFREKVQRRVADLGLNKARAARDVGLPASTISNYASKIDSLPRIDIALKMSRALNVPLEWLADDAQDWPPPTTESGSTLKSKVDVSKMSNDALMGEIARRYRLAALDFLDEVRRAKMVDWQEAATRIENLPGDAPLPPEVHSAMITLNAVQVKFSVLKQTFDVELYATMHHSELPGFDRPLKEFDLVARGFLWQEVEDMPSIKRFAEVVQSRPEWHSDPSTRKMASLDRYLKAYYAAYPQQGFELESIIAERIEKAQQKRSEGDSTSNKKIAK